MHKAFFDVHAQCALMNEFTCSAHSVRIRRSEKTAALEINSNYAVLTSNK